MTTAEKGLTRREYEILNLISDEYSNKEIAAHLFIAVGTVETHRKNLFQKLGARNMAGLISRAYDKLILIPKRVGHHSRNYQ